MAVQIEAGITVPEAGLRASFYVPDAMIGVRLGKGVAGHGGD